MAEFTGVTPPAHVRPRLTRAGDLQVGFVIDGRDYTDPDGFGRMPPPRCVSCTGGGWPGRRSPNWSTRTACAGRRQPGRDGRAERRGRRRRGVQLRIPAAQRLWQHLYWLLGQQRQRQPQPSRPRRIPASNRRYCHLPQGGPTVSRPGDGCVCRWLPSTAPIMPWVRASCPLYPTSPNSSSCCWRARLRPHSRCTVPGLVGSSSPGGAARRGNLKRITPGGLATHGRSTHCDSLDTRPNPDGQQ